MGLDMYLTRSTYIGGEYEHRKVSGKVNLSVNGESIVFDPKKLSYIKENIGYWRKANHIHRWFVENVQDNEDDCKEYNVSLDQLKELLGLVDLVLKNSNLVHGVVGNGYSFKDGKQVANLEPGEQIEDTSTAKELLPAREGFFFGGTDYDQWYYDVLVETKKILETVIKEHKDYYDYYYHSSW